MSEKNFLKGESYISIDQITEKSQIEMIFEEADKLQEIVLSKKPSDILEGYTVAELFYQPSTRTFTSFLAAAKWLGALTIPIHGMSAYSSAVKGETIGDTVRSIHQTTAADLIVMRHPDDNSSEVAKADSYVPMVNAGSGKKEHPTQALLDLYTIYNHLGRTSNLDVVFVGDMKYGRTVKSLAKLLGVADGGLKLTFVAPEALSLPEENRKDLEEMGVKVEETTDLTSVISEADVMYVTRVQKEWFKDQMDLYNEIKDDYIIDEEMMKLAKEDMIVMHPLPRVNEITTDIDKDPRAKYFEQMRSGLYVRMALLKLILVG
jgi:aspartate carbamoyltransferase